MDECSIPNFGADVSYDLPTCTNSTLTSVITEYKDLFRNQPGLTSEAQHYIHTTGSPVKVPPRCIPVHYREEVESQISEMLKRGIIKESSSPWMAPAVFTKKKSGDMCISHLCRLP